MALRGRLEDTPLQEVLQVVAYSQLSGVLSVEGPSVEGTVIFEKGNVVCTLSPGSLMLMLQAAKAQEPRDRLALRRVQALVSLRELFELKSGSFEFEKKEERVSGLHGVAMSSFYAAGAMDTGDLLLALAKLMEDEPRIPPSEPSPPRAEARERVHPRYGPIAVRAELVNDGKRWRGFLTNLSVGGAFFHAESLPAVNCVAELRFTLPGVAEPCRGKARVVWSQADRTGTRRGAGLAFEEMEQASRKALSIYLSRFEQLAVDLDFSA